jgi:hypothetical protein
MRALVAAALLIGATTYIEGRQRGRATLRVTRDGAAGLLAIDVS